MITKDLYELFLENPNICTDSRQLKKNSLFFALKGEKFDGNKYAEKALETCSYAIVDDPAVVKDKRYILVEDALIKLQLLAAFHRKRLGIPILAITGTNGKTTTKELISAVLSKKYNVLSTSGNFNNHIGVPLTLLQITDQHEFGVIEMGANHVGEIKALCKIAAPDFGIITNVGKAHLEGFGSLGGVKKAKGELYEYLYDNDGLAFVNYDNEMLEDMGPPHSVLYYGTKEFTHCQGNRVDNNMFVSLKWRSSDDFNADENCWNLDEYTIKSKLIGDYNFENMLAAVCVGHKFGVSALDIKAAIENYEPKNNRSQLIKTTDNMIIMDGYNANPTSMKAAIKNFAQLDLDNKLMILGDMNELGSKTQIEHSSLLGMIKEFGLKDFFLVGPIFSSLDLKECNTIYSNLEDFVDFLKRNPIKNKAILIKGSRGIGLEKVLELL